MAQTVKTVMKTQNGASTGSYGSSKVTGIELFAFVDLCDS